MPISRHEYQGLISGLTQIPHPMSLDSRQREELRRLNRGLPPLGNVFQSGDISSDSEDEKQEITNGVGTTILGEKPAKADPEQNKDNPDEEMDEKYEAGMKFGLKNLYSGKEDKKGRYQWQDTIPENLGGPAENDKTAKWALLVRNVKVYNDPQKVLAIHSIVVQSPLLKKLLSGVLKGYPGVTVGLQRLEFSGKFEPLIHRWPELNKAIAALGDETEDEKTTKSHAILLQNVLMKEFKSLIDTCHDMKSKRVITYEYLWTLFEPGQVVYMRKDGQETANILVDTRYGFDDKNVPCFWLICKHVDWDGTKFGIQKTNRCIYIFQGTTPINQLCAFPLQYHHDPDKLRTRLIERGAKAESLAGPNFKAYSGIGWRNTPQGNKDQYQIQGRIIIDTYGWNRFNTTNAIYVSSLGLTAMEYLNSSESEHTETSEEESTKESTQESTDESTKESTGYSTGESAGESTGESMDESIDDSGIPPDGYFADESSSNKRLPLTTQQKLICTPLLRGYSIKLKLWLNFFVNCVKEIEWQTDAFDRLVLSNNQKELVLGFTKSQQKYRGKFDDVIEGKGRGMIILLCGPPGVGKTLTAESVAEEMKVPLYMMSAGDLGTDPRRVEQQLTDILEMCSRWNAVCLLDEADVFLEKRSLHELERNKLVTIFLRILEYYEGTMFLTTNRVDTFDPAFQSRIHISLDYPELSLSSKKLVWKNFLDSFPEEHEILPDQINHLSKMSLNGRQIKNILKIARLLATRKEEKLHYHHIVTTLEVTQHLHNETQLSERSRGSLYQ